MPRKPASRNTPAERAENPRERIGGNNPPGLIADADSIKESLPVEYADMAESVTNLLADANRDIPKIITSDEELAVVTRTVVALRTKVQGVEAARVKEKAPYLASERIIDNFFKAMATRLDTAMTVIGKRGHLYNTEKLERERIERARLAREAEDKARAEREEAERMAREAERARSKKKAAELAEQQADQAAAAAVAAQQAQAAREAAGASSADMARQRFDSGHMATARQVAYADVTDYDKLPLDKLRPYIPRDALDKAVKAFARMTQHKEALPGADIGFRDDTVYR